MCVFKISNSNMGSADFHAQMALGGPTAHTTIDVNGVLISHWLLSITGKATTQPVLDNGKYFLLLGEIYNYDTRFASDIYFGIEKYHQFGNAFTQHLDGEFLFIVVDPVTKTIDFFSDPWGTRQLFFYQQQDIWCFSTLPVTEPASRPEARFLFYRRYDDRALNQYFLEFERDWQSSNQRLVGNSHYQFDIRTQSLRLINHALHTWNLTQNKNTFDDLTRAFEHAVLKRHTFQSVLFLSGGIDSGAIAACLADHQIVFSSVTLKLESFEDENSLGSILEYTNRHNVNHMIINEDFVDSTYHQTRQLLQRRRSIDPMSSSQMYIREQAKTRFGCNVILMGSGADEVLDNYMGKGLSSFFRWPENISDIFPWDHFYNGMARRLLDFHETISLAYGLENRSIFYDKRLAQEWINISPGLKNTESKVFLKDYLRKRGIAISNKVAGFQDPKLKRLGILRDKS